MKLMGYLKNFFEKLSPMEGGKIKKIIFLAVAMTVIANLLLGNAVLAKKLEITDKDVGDIKSGLDLVKMLVNLSVNESTLKTVLNTVISGGKTGTDVTYGLLVLTSLNEMDLIDMVVSQRYKAEATAYFDSILDQRINLRNYYKGIGYDLPRVMMGKITSPVAASTLNTFEITGGIVDIAIAVENVVRVEVYNGLWRYLNSRRSNDPHNDAWENAKIEMGWVIDAETIRRLSRWHPAVVVDNKVNQLESQFAVLYDKWGPYTDSRGVKEEFKKQVKSELGNTLVSAINSQKFVEVKKEPDILEKIKLTWESLMKKTESIGGLVREKLTQIGTKIQQLANIGGAQISQTEKIDIQEPNPESSLATEAKSESAPEQSLPQEEPRTEESQKALEEIVSEIDAVSKEINKPIEKLAEEVGEKAVATTSATTTEEQTEIKSEIKLGAEAGTEKTTSGLCERAVNASPLQNKIILNKIAWMGSQNSANDEWIELKNTSGSVINLAGWQVLDKDSQIKIVLGGGPSSAQLTANGVYLLERTDDNSLPGTTADLIYTGALNDTDEAVYLFDNNCQLMDEVLASPDWLAGDKTNRRPMGRVAGLNWQTEGGLAVILNYGTSPPPPPPPAPSPSSSSSEQTLPKILITEIKISPIGERFVELYNPNNEAVNLTGWYIQRKTQTGSSWNSFVTKGDFEGKIIGALSHFFVSSSTGADILLSLTLTEGNSLILKNSNQEIVDKIGWGQAQEFETASAENPPSGKSIGRKWSTTSQSYIDTDNNQNDFEIQTPTPRARNQSPSLSSNNQAPVAFFVYTPGGPAVGQEVIFNSASSTDSDGTVTAFIWDFGDAISATSSTATTSHSFASSSVFLVSLQVVDNSGATSSAATTSVSVSQPETSTLAVVINEIAWMGTSATNSSKEWIELYNNSSSTIDLSGWTLKAAGGTPSTTFSGANGTTTIPAGGYFLLERTNGSTTNIAEDYIFTGALSNDGEKLELRDASSALIDLVDFASGWPAGASSPNYISMERINSIVGSDPTNWASNNLITRNGLDVSGNKINGTPRARNSVQKVKTEITSSIFYQLFEEFSEITLTFPGSPYLIQETLTVPLAKNLKIEPGVVLKFATLKGLEIKGKLEALGSSEKKIVFTSFRDDEFGGDTNQDGTSTLPFAGLWERIYFENSIGSKLKNVIVRYGGKIYSGSGPTLIRGNVEVDGGEIIFEDSTVENSQTYGLWLKNSSSTIFNLKFSNIKNSADFFAATALFISSSTAQISSSTFQGNTFGIKITGNAVPTIKNNLFKENGTPIYLEGTSFPVFSGNSAQNNNLNGIFADSGSIVADTVWQSNLPYITETKSIASGATLTIKAGTVVKLKKNQYGYASYWDIFGRLITEGTLANPVVFTSFYDDEYGGDVDNNGTTTLPAKGEWKYLRFRSTSTASTLDGLMVRYGGGSCDGGFCWGAITQTRDVSIEIKNSIIEKNIWGIFSNESSCQNVFQKIKLENTTFSQNNINVRRDAGEQCAP
ncbi:MAG: lamin tail domain-containing protein [Candidatus Wildermuthbacteria bacterium]|nr:lamin tail domain-containing protein [Candidatus Wildermuthbacteria bacterium]